MGESQKHAKCEKSNINAIYYMILFIRNLSKKIFCIFIVVVGTQLYTVNKYYPTVFKIDDFLIVNKKRKNK